MLAKLFTRVKTVDKFYDRKRETVVCFAVTELLNALLCKKEQTVVPESC